MLLEVRHDEPGFMTGNQCSTDITGKQDAGRGVVQREIPGGVAIMGGDGLDVRTPIADLDAHAMVGDCVEFDGIAGAEMADESGPQPRAIGGDGGIQIEPHGERRGNVRILMAGKDRTDILDPHIFGQFGEHLREDLDAPRVQQYGLAVADNDVLVRIDDVRVFFGIATDRDPLVAVFVEERLTLRRPALSITAPPYPHRR